MDADVRSGAGWGRVRRFEAQERRAFTFGQKPFARILSDFRCLKPKLQHYKNVETTIIALQGTRNHNYSTARKLGTTLVALQKTENHNYSAAQKNGHHIKALQKNDSNPFRWCASADKQSHAQVTFLFIVFSAFRL